jgi:hypothetical protein
MGLFDRIELPAGLSLPGFDGDPSTIEWQTKSLGRPLMRRFRLTEDGRLLQEETHSEPAPEAEDPYRGTDNSEEFTAVGSTRVVHDDWTERRYHGIVEFHASLDEEVARYEARFADGRLTAVRDVTGEDTGEWLPAADILPDGDARLTAPEVRRLDELLDTLEAELDAIEDNDDRTRATRDSLHPVRAYLERREMEGQ